ncbi:MAG TPA: GGDEF domain-containing protein [Noviherbaspirillum sp.]|uniref:GGDEF domain-containing protein n=1 Tax=Noviherbaspirillum sp. TaxID=1926288 RepID=UPI002B4A8938|nr:GGDEF domain-containing protein [Noviherbaspirillum sp.]HJV84149.1 GGDEF domain-containing protein [Noviherbaspirillum sp.]
MLSTQYIFLIAALLCFLTFLVLYGVRANRIAGIDEILMATLLGTLGNLLYAFGRELPPLLAYEAANGVYAAASASLFIGYRRLFKQRPYRRVMLVAVLLFTLAAAFFHYVLDSFLGRSALVSLFQAGIAAGIAMALLQARTHWDKPYYTKLFILFVCGVVAVGHLGRVLWQIVAPVSPTSLLQPSTASILFLSAATVALPAIAFGGLLLAHRRIVSMAEEAANRDFLTGAWSRRAFFNMGKHELVRAARTGRPLAIMLVDFDNFKPINDQYGHDAGDRVLVSFTHRAEAALRAIDCLARMGGDEFAVLMPETDLAGATAAAYRLKKSVETGKSGDGLVGVTLSIGVSVLQQGDSLKTLLKRADIALYEAKAKGRTQVVCHPVASAG